LSLIEGAGSDYGVGKAMQAAWKRNNGGDDSWGVGRGEGEQDLKRKKSLQILAWTIENGKGERRRVCISENDGASAEN